MFDVTLTWTVYALIDPDDGSIRYVGSTSGSPSVRLSRHMTTARSWPRSEKDRWIRSLLDRGNRPEIVALEAGHAPSAAGLRDVREAEWIALFLLRGSRLFNDRLTLRAAVMADLPTPGVCFAGRKLIDILNRRGLTIEEATRAIGFSSVWSFVSGHRFPRTEIRVAIERWSEGEIRAPEWGRLPAFRSPRRLGLAAQTPTPKAA